MDFHTLPRRDLQALCKRNRIPANITNVAMADALAALPTVEGMDDALMFLSPQKPEMVVSDLPRTGRKTTARKVVITVPDEEKEGQASPLPRSRRVNAKVGIVAFGEEEKEKEVVVLEEKPETPAPRTLRRTRAVPTPVTRPTTRTTASTRGKTSAVEDTEAKVAEEVVAPVTVGRSTRGRATAKKVPQLEETEEKPAVTGTRRSTRAKAVTKMAPLVQEVEELDVKDVNEETVVSMDQNKEKTVELNNESEIKEPMDLPPVEEKVASGDDSEQVKDDDKEIEVSVDQNKDEAVELNTESEIKAPMDLGPIEEKVASDGDLEQVIEAAEIADESPIWGVVEQSEESIEELQQSLSEASSDQFLIEETPSESVTTDVLIVETKEVNVSVKETEVEITEPEMVAKPELCSEFVSPADEEVMENVVEGLQVLDFDGEKNNSSMTATPLEKKSLRKLKSLLREKLNKQNCNKMEVKRTALAAVNENQL